MCISISEPMMCCGMRDYCGRSCLLMATGRLYKGWGMQGSAEMYQRLGWRAATIYDSRSNSEYAQAGASIDVEGNV